MGKLADDRPRPHHYLFAHRVLPKLALKHGAKMLEMAKEARLTPALERTWDDAGSGVPKDDRLGHDGLESSVHRLQAADLVLIRLPPAQHAAEAHFVAITIPSPNDTGQPRAVRYFALEFGWQMNDQPRTVLCEWVERSHVNMGDGPPVRASAFIAAVAEVLDRGPRSQAPTRLP